MTSPDLQPRPRLVLGTTSRQWWVLAVVAGLAAALLAGVLLGRATDSFRAISDPVDIGFARDMGVHHAQAVEMSSIVHHRTSDPRLRFLAFDIMTTQQGQIGRMSGWLELWRQTPSTAGRPAMAWMGDPHDGPMPGMASKEQVAALQVLPLAAMEEQFLRLMIRHHRSAVPMADFAAARATSVDVRDFAKRISVGQAAEIELMQDYLKARGVAPEGETPTRGETPTSSPSVPGHDGHG